jgi:hypothetical protein
MDEPQFVSFATQHFRLDPLMASAAFEACDVDGSGERVIRGGRASSYIAVPGGAPSLSNPMASSTA